MSKLMESLSFVNYGYQILSGIFIRIIFLGVNSVKDTVNKFLQKPEISEDDRLELRSIERRLNMLIHPLNQCILASQNLDSVTRLSLNHTKDLIDELIKFLSSLISDIPYKIGIFKHFLLLKRNFISTISIF